MTTSIFRISVLVALCLVGFITLFGEPLDNSATWFLDLLASKVVAALCFYGIYRLYPAWAKTDKWVGAFERWTTKDMEDCC